MCAQAIAQFGGGVRMASYVLPRGRTLTPTPGGFKEAR
jgi:hypothetical protein